MSYADLKAALTAVDWNQNVASFLQHPASGQKAAKANLRIAVWARQLEAADVGNPALSFIREMQSASQLVSVLLGLALYRSAAASMRSMLEAALYYSYFRNHTAELATLARGQGYYIDKSGILAFHKAHTVDYVAVQSLLGVNSKLEKWYGRMSALIHGQIPGMWTPHLSIADVKPDPEIEAAAIKCFLEGEEVLHLFFLSTVGRDLWDDFSSSGKSFLLKGLSKGKKIKLALDSA
ncbi:MAG: hypothetical protein RLN84_08250 [Rhodospirillaceae bacterium]